MDSYGYNRLSATFGYRQVIGQLCITGRYYYLLEALDYLTPLLRTVDIHLLWNIFNSNHTEAFHKRYYPEVMCQHSRISELASLIQAHTSKIDKYLLSGHLQSPSLDITTVAPNPSDELQISQNAILEATDELNVLVQGPLPFLINLVTSNVRDVVHSFSARALTGVLAQFPHQPARHLPLQNFYQLSLT